jgi:putative methanogenesis marker protein 8
LDEMELLGKTKVKVKDGRVVQTGEPLIRWCPLFDKVRGIKEITPEAAAANMEFRMREHGMFTPKRKLEMDVFVGFGASEVMMTATSRGLIEAAVTVCDGAGTVITDNPSLIQGMGGWISGLVETDPIPEVLAGIENRGGIVLDPKTAKIDQVEGARLAAERYSKFAVTVADAETAKELRRLEKERNVQILIVGVHLTGIGEGEADRLIAAADIVTSCASKFIREKVRPLVQVGTAVPLFGLTRWGKEVLVERAKEVDRPILINTMPLPVLPENKQPRPLV